MAGQSQLSSAPILEIYSGFIGLAELCAERIGRGRALKIYTDNSIANAKSGGYACLTFGHENSLPSL
jgi:hypothetical protein